MDELRRRYALCYRVDTDTEMNTIEIVKTIDIVVDKLPESCAACPYSADKYVIRCIVLDKPGKNYCRLPNCPLVTWRPLPKTPEVKE